ncbi:MAG: DUF3616 domain-containing protein [Planctomycetales bacterium]|nr:DUF3616 domain-containing protein [Planctomycetales bacterium]
MSIIGTAVLPAWALAQSSPTVDDGPEYTGMCDASAAAALSGLGFIVANDEDNVLRVFSRTQGGPAAVTLDLTPFLRPDAKNPETDIEGATWLGNKVVWITSHGRNKDGKLRLSRHRLFATEFVKVEGRTTIRGTGVPYSFLLDDLIPDPLLDKYSLHKAMRYAPKDDQGLNIEGLTSTPEGHLWIAFRNPVPEKKALIVPLVNPLEVLEGGIPAKRCRFDTPIELDLNGLGIRSIEYHAPWQTYIILAGPKSSGEVKLYLWSGARDSSPVRIEQVDFGSMTPEAFVCYRDGDETVLQLFSDDGTRPVDGMECKALTNPADRHFRSVFIRGLK